MTCLPACYVRYGETRWVDGGTVELNQPGDDKSNTSSRGDNADSAGEGSPRSHSTRYRMSSDLAALGTDFLILNGDGEHVLRVNGVELAERDTIVVEDLKGRPLFRALAHHVRKANRLTILDAMGTEAGAVRRSLDTPLRDRFSIELSDGTTLEVQGHPAAYEFSIIGPNGVIATISRRWFRATNSYGIETTPGQPDAFLIASIIALDLMVHGGTPA